MNKQQLKNLLSNPLFIRYKYYILPVVSILVSISLIIFLIVPQGSKLYKVSKTTQESDDKTSFLQKKLDLLQKVDATEYQSLIDTSLISLPEDKDYSGAINQIVTVVKNNNLRLDGMGISTVVTTIDNAQSYAIKIDVTGDINSIKNFMTAIKSGPRLMRVNSIEVTSSKNASQVASSIGLIVFYQETQKSLGSVDQPLVLPAEKDKDVINSLKTTTSGLVGSPTEVIDTNIPKGKSDPFQ